MYKYILLIALVFLAIGCENVELKREVPSSPVESLQPLPK